MKQSFVIIMFILISKLNYSQLKSVANKSIDKKEKVIIFDKLTKPAAILVWYDKYYDEHSIKPCGTYNLKKFGPKRELQIESPTLLILPIGIQVPYLIYESDTLSFYDKGLQSLPKAGNPTLKHNRIQQRTNELKFFEEIYDSLGACYGQHSYSIPGKIQTYKEVVEYLKNKLNERLIFLSNKFNQKKIGERFFEYAKTFFEYKFYDDVFMGLKANRYFELSKKVEILNYADSLVKELNGKDAASYAWYEALMSYVELKMKAEDSITLENFDLCLKNIALNLKGNARNFAVFYYYKYLLNYSNLSFLNLKLDKLKQYCDDEDYADYIIGNTSFNKEIVNKNKSEKTTDFLLNVDKQKVSFKGIIDSLKGNVIYIDFWASWCIPCIEEIPFSKNLIEQYKGEKLAFIFISMDKYSLPWISSLQKNEMKANGYQYLILDTENNFFVKKYNIGPIPRYFLINKKGEVVYPDAPRPSENRIKDLISKLLVE